MITPELFASWAIIAALGMIIFNQKRELEAYKQTVNRSLKLLAGANKTLNRRRMYDAQRQQPQNANGQFESAHAFNSASSEDSLS